jgi:hypothetical protein
MPGPIKAKNGARNCPARKNRMREDSDDFRRQIGPPQTPKTPKIMNRQSQPNRNSGRIPGKSLLFLAKKT